MKVSFPSIFIGNDGDPEGEGELRLFPHARVEGRAGSQPAEISKNPELKIHDGRTHHLKPPPYGFISGHPGDVSLFAGSETIEDDPQFNDTLGSVEMELEVSGNDKMDKSYDRANENYRLFVEAKGASAPPNPQLSFSNQPFGVQFLYLISPGEVKIDFQRSWTTHTELVTRTYFSFAGFH